MHFRNYISRLFFTFYSFVHFNYCSEAYLDNVKQFTIT